MQQEQQRSPRRSPPSRPDQKFARRSPASPDVQRSQGHGNHKSAAIGQGQVAQLERDGRELEEREGAFLQHIRTAGLRKGRENALIEEFHGVRKARRQLCTGWSHVAEEWKSAYRDSEERQSYLTSQLEREMQLQADEFRAVLERKRREGIETQERYERTIAELSAQNEEEKAKLQASLQKTYQEKLRELQRASEAWQESQSRDVDARVEEESARAKKGIEKEMWARFRNVAETLEQECRTRIRKNKTATADAVVRRQEAEHNLEKALQKQQRLEQQLQQALRENQQMRDGMETTNQQMEEVERQAREALAREKQNAKRVAARLVRMEKTLRRQELDAETAVRTMRIEHDKEIAAIDSKVRSAMAAKENAERKLRRELAHTKQQLREAEQFMEELSSGIVSADASHGGRRPHAQAVENPGPQPPLPPS